MKSVEILFLLITVITGSIGQFFLKNGAKQLGSVNANNVLTQAVGIATNFNLVVGLIFYAVAAVLYILMLTRVPLSVLAPAVSLQYVLSMLMGKYFFGEIISFNRLVGLGMIVAGVILVVWEK